MIINPAIFVRKEIFDTKKAPIHVADAPRRINTIENPTTKNIELNIIMRLSLLRNAVLLSFPVISSMETPDIKEIYPGTSGKTHGDRNEINPAANAMYMETSWIITSDVQ